MGTFMVFGGTAIFVDLIPKLMEYFSEPPKPKTE